MFMLSFLNQKKKVGKEDVKNKTFLYKGFYNHGNATYEYITTKYFRIFNGRFRYKYSYGKRAKDQEVVIGNYSNNKKTGLWEYKFHENGVKRKLKVEYADGVPSGLYEYNRKGGENNDHRAYVYTTMKNGHPVGKFNAFFCNSTVVGECDSSGYPDGTWCMDMEGDENHIVYYEKWNHGQLMEFYYIDTTTGNRYDQKMDIFVKLKCFVKYECYPIESIIKKGSIRWHGDILSIDFCGIKY